MPPAGPGSGHTMWATAISLFTNKYAKDMVERQVHTLSEPSFLPSPPALHSTSQAGSQATVGGGCRNPDAHS